MKRAQLFLLGVSFLIFEVSVAQTTMAGSFAGQVDTAHYYMKHSYDVLKYRLNIDLYHCYQSPFSSRFSATEVITFKADSVLNLIRLNAVNTSLHIDSVGLAAISFLHANDTLTILLDHKYQPGSLVRVQIFYKHQNVRDHAVYSGGGFLFTDNPPEGARKWFPCWDRPSDKALLDLTAKVPLNVKLGSNGDLADSIIKADSLYYHWVSRDPMSTYLMTISSKVNYSLEITYYHKPSHPKDSIPVRFYFQPPENPDSLKPVIKSMADFYSGLFGDYPFEKIGFATLDSSFSWGGMENQTMINLAANGWQEELIAHEFSHQWFGDLITCGTWADIWLNESFATYCESLWLEHSKGDLAYNRYLEVKAITYIFNDPGFPVWNPCWAIQTPGTNLLYNTPVEYDKGACVLHQLRYVVGDSVFFQILKAYALDTNFRFKTAVTLDFIDKSNEISGTNLDWFFDEWLMHPHHPVYSNSFEIKNTGDGKWNLHLVISQKQENTCFFKMPVQLQVVFSDSTSAMLKVMNDVNPQMFDFVFDKHPVNLIFDPLWNILLKESSTSKKPDSSMENSHTR
jgi:aminopeptidase N